MYGPGPGAPGWSAYPPPAIRVPVNTARATRNVALGGIVTLGLGLSAVVPAIIGGSAVEGGTGSRVGIGVVGGLFAILGLLLLLGLGKVRRPRALVFDARGVAWEDTGGPSWAVCWGELTRVCLTTGYHQGTGRSPNLKTVRIRFLLAPGDPSFPQRHPEMQQLFGRYGGGSGYGLPLGGSKELIGPIDAGMRAFAGRAYGGVIDEGRLIGFGYV